MLLVLGAGRRPAAIVRTWSRVRLSDMRCTNVPVTFEFYLCLTPPGGPGLHLDTAARDGLPARSAAQLSVRIGPASGELAERDAFVSIGRAVDQSDLHW